MIPLWCAGHEYGGPLTRDVLSTGERFQDIALQGLSRGDIVIAAHHQEVDVRWS